MKTPTAMGFSYKNQTRNKLEKSCIESLRVTSAKKKSKAGQKIEDVKDGLGLGAGKQGTQGTKLMELPLWCRLCTCPS